MPLQTQVKQAYARGVAGMMVNPSNTIYTPINLLAEDDKVTVGHFCFDGTDSYRQVKGSGEKVKGFVQRVIASANTDLTSGAKMHYNENDDVAVAVKGDFYAVSQTFATYGQKVFASKEDGSISTGDAGSVIENHVETDFVVKDGAEAGNLIVISNW